MTWANDNSNPHVVMRSESALYEVGVPATAPEDQEEWWTTMTDEEDRRNYDPRDHEPGPWSQPDGYVPPSERYEL